MITLRPTICAIRISVIRFFVAALKDRIIVGMELDVGLPNCSKVSFS